MGAFSSAFSSAFDVGAAVPDRLPGGWLGGGFRRRRRGTDRDELDEIEEEMRRIRQEAEEVRLEAEAEARKNRPVESGLPYGLVTGPVRIRNRTPLT